jgi:hypothetical protein
VVRRVDQDTASPIDILKSVSNTDPMRGKNHDVAIDCLLLRPGDGARTRSATKSTNVSGPLEFDTTMV